MSSESDRPPIFRSSGRRRALKGHVMLDDRTERRLRRIRWRRILIALGVVGLVAALVAVYESPLLRVQNVEISGTNVVDAAKVKALAPIQGESMLRLDTTAIQEQIAFLPMVKSVTITRHWPQTVRIQVTERTPWGYWKVGDTQYPIDADGVVVDGVKPPDNAPVITDLSNPVRLVPGDHVDSDAVMLTQALLAQVPAKLKLNIASLEYSPAAGLALVTDAGYRVVVGDSENMDYKLSVWQAIEGQLGRDAMAGHVLDLRFGDRPSFQ